MIFFMSLLCFFFPVVTTGSHQLSLIFTKILSNIKILSVNNPLCIYSALNHNNHAHGNGARVLEGEYHFSVVDFTETH